ncbi:hypothetical protein NDU88_006201 [Pleurodeles waltl]|uniref:Uncharacterized protein n=1 Tax=Pleurodeles waltl TaxID=8319 RepID=A0AAV7MYK8_PLEWA|nr:hypothetical protein NDU88_006201 [Pleurodeles waltl]
MGSRPWRKHPHYYKAPIHQLFWGGTNAIKSTAETVHRKETTHLLTLNKELGRHGARIADPTHVAVSINTPRSGKKTVVATHDTPWRLSYTPSCGDIGCQLLVRISAGGGVTSGVSRTSPADSDGCTMGMGLMSDRVASAVHVAVLMVVHVAVSAVEMLPVLAVVQVTVVVDGDTIAVSGSLGWLILGEDAAD